MAPVAVRTERGQVPDSPGGKRRDQPDATGPGPSRDAKGRERLPVLAAHPATPEVPQHEQHDEDDDDDDDDGLKTHHFLLIDVRRLCGPDGTAS